MKPYLALYMGGMGAEDTNFHADVYRRMGYAEVVDDVTTLFRTDRKDEAATSSPTNSSTTPRSSATSTTCASRSRRGKPLALR